MPLVKQGQVECSFQPERNGSPREGSGAGRASLCPPKRSASRRDRISAEKGAPFAYPASDGTSDDMDVTEDSPAPAAKAAAAAARDAREAPAGLQSSPRALATIAPRRGPSASAQSGGSPLPPPRTGRRGAPQAFPHKLFHILSDAHNARFVRWTKDGQGFVILDQGGFAESVLPKYFRHKNFPSFQRQLNLYGFRKLLRNVKKDRVGPFANAAQHPSCGTLEDEHCYWHPSFRRDQPRLISKLFRARQSHHATSVGSAPSAAPNSNAPGAGMGPPHSAMAAADAAAAGAASRRPRADSSGRKVPLPPRAQDLPPPPMHPYAAAPWPSAGPYATAVPVLMVPYGAPPMAMAPMMAPPPPFLRQNGFSSGIFLDAQSHAPHPYRYGDAASAAAAAPPPPPPPRRAPRMSLSEVAGADEGGGDREGGGGGAARAGRGPGGAQELDRSAMIDQLKRRLSAQDDGVGSPASSAARSGRAHSWLRGKCFFPPTRGNSLDVDEPSFARGRPMLKRGGSGSSDGSQRSLGGPGAAMSSQDNDRAQAAHLLMQVHRKREAPSLPLTPTNPLGLNELDLSPRSDLLEYSCFASLINTPQLSPRRGGDLSPLPLHSPLVGTPGRLSPPGEPHWWPGELSPKPGCKRTGAFEEAAAGDMVKKAKLIGEEGLLQQTRRGRRPFGGKVQL